MYDIYFNTTFNKIKPISTVDELNLYIQQTGQVHFCEHLQKHLLKSLTYYGNYASYSNYSSYGNKLSADDYVNKLLCKLGYKQNKQKAFSLAKQRLLNTLKTSLLGFDTAYFDFRYSQAEFVCKLCEVLLDKTAIQCKANDSLCELAITQINEFYNFYNTSPTPWIYVDTGFIRTSQPIFALALLENNRRIALPKTLQLLPNNEQIQQISRLVKQHYQHYQNESYQGKNHEHQHAGKLGIWGDILQYVYLFAEYEFIDNQLIHNNERQLVFNVTGQTTSEESKAIFSKAILKI